MCVQIDFGNYFNLILTPVTKSSVLCLRLKTQCAMVSYPKEGLKLEGGQV